MSDDTDNDDVVFISRIDMVRALPSHLSGSITDGLVEDINSIMHEDELRDNFRDNIVSFNSVLSDGKFKLISYLNAVRYVTYRINGDSKSNAWAKTFPDRYDKLVAEKASAARISASAGMYDNTLLVKKILEQSLTPIHVVFKDVMYEAITEAADLMRNAKSEKVRGDMALGLIKELKPPEKTQISIDTNTTQHESVISRLEAIQQGLAQSHLESMNHGVTLDQIGATKHVTEKKEDDD